MWLWEIHKKYSKAASLPGDLYNWPLFNKNRNKKFDRQSFYVKNSIMTKEILMLK